MRVSLLFMVVVAGCAADAVEPAPIVVDRSGDELTMASPEGPDLCALAAALPDDDICSLICDPPAMAAQLVADGSETGACYQLRCDLAEDVYALVGVCLPP